MSKQTHHEIVIIKCVPRSSHVTTWEEAAGEVYTGPLAEFASKHQVYLEFEAITNSDNSNNSSIISWEAENVGWEDVAYEVEKDLLPILEAKLNVTKTFTLLTLWEVEYTVYSATWDGPEEYATYYKVVGSFSCEDIYALLESKEAKA